MQIFEIFENKYGIIESVKLSGGEEFHNLSMLNQWCKENSEVIYGENLNALIVAANSSPFIDSSLRGKSLQIHGCKFVGMERWRLNLKADDDSVKIVEDLLKFYKVERLPRTPANFVAKQMSHAASPNDLLERGAKGMSLKEIFLSSTKLGERGFSPAYRGGLLASPADPTVMYENVRAYDVNSMYPWAAVAAQVPLGRSFETPLENLKTIKFMENGFIEGMDGYGYVGLFEAKGVRRKGFVSLNIFRNEGFYAEDGQFDAKGLKEAEIVRFASCPYDLEIFKMQYDFDSLECLQLHVHKIGKMPEYITTMINQFYVKKSEASGAERINAKISINSIVGYFGVDPFNSFAPEKLKQIQYFSQMKDLEKCFDSYVKTDSGWGVSSGMKRSWDYRWGIYVTAFARLRLARMEKLMTAMGLEVLYGDTDSIKVVGDAEIADACISLDQPVSGELGRWKDESEEYNLGAVFKGVKMYAFEGSKEGKQMRASGLPEEAVDKILSKYSIEEIAKAPKIKVTATKRGVMPLVMDPFGAGEAYGRIIVKIKY